MKEQTGKCQGEQHESHSSDHPSCYWVTEESVRVGSHVQRLIIPLNLLSWYQWSSLLDRLQSLDGSNWTLVQCVSKPLLAHIDGAKLQSSRESKANSETKKSGKIEHSDQVSDAKSCEHRNSSSNQSQRKTE